MRILLAEDEKELSNALSVILRHNNFSVDPVYDGQDALDYLEAENYDAAILDIMMPKVDGITVLRRIRAQGNAIPVLILTDLALIAFTFVMTYIGAGKIRKISVNELMTE